MLLVEYRSIEEHAKIRRRRLKPTLQAEEVAENS